MRWDGRGWDEIDEKHTHKHNTHGSNLTANKERSIRSCLFKDDTYIYTSIHESF